MNKYRETVRNMIEQSSCLQQAIIKDPIKLISLNSSRRNKKKGIEIKYKSKVDVVKKEIDEEKIKFLEQLFKSRCSDFQVGFNKSNWDGFLQSFTNKNKNPEELNLEDFNFGQRSSSIINLIISNYSKVNLSKNLLDPSKLTQLFKTNLRELRLNNCGLANQQLQSLFTNLLNTNIVILSLSSPFLKDRNQLTKYDALVLLINSSKTLTTLELSNMQIKKDNPIIGASKNTILSVIDLSKNTGVIDLNKTLKSLNLSYNGITNPLSLNVEECSIEHLNLSYNQIPFYHFKLFLKTTNYPILRQLILDKIVLSGQLVPLQIFLQRSPTLINLSMVECNMSIEALLSVAKGLDKNGVLARLNISGNKIEKRVAIALGESLKSCKLKQLIMCSCQLKDNLGGLMLEKINVNKWLEHIDLSKNLIGSLTSIVICENLKKSFYNLMKINLNQTFIKYDHLQEISEYVIRNNYLARVQLKFQWKQLYDDLKTCKQDVIQQLQNQTQKIQHLKQEQLQKQIQYHRSIININRINKAIIKGELQKIDAKQKQYEKQIIELMEEMGQLQQPILGGQSQLLHHTINNPERQH